MNVGTGIPDLWSVLTIPSEGQNILSSLQRLRNLHQVLECPGVIALWMVRKVNLGPLRPMRSGSVGGADQGDGEPAILVEIFIFRMPVDPGSVALHYRKIGC